MNTIQLDKYPAYFEGDFMEREFNPDLLQQVGQVGLTVLFDEMVMPDDYNVMVTDKEYIFRLIPPTFNDGFTIYRVPKSDVHQLDQ